MKISSIIADIIMIANRDHGDLQGLTDDDHTQYILHSILTTQGDILIRGAATTERLAAGTSGQFLKTQGAGSSPVWGDTPSSLLCGRISGLVVGTNIRYGSIFGASTAGAALTEMMKIVMPKAGTVKTLRVKLSAAVDGSGFRVVIFQNGAITSLVCDVAGAATTCSDLVNTLTIAAGDTLSVRGSGKTGQTVNTDGLVSVEFLSKD